MGANVVFNPLTGVFVFFPEIIYFRPDRYTLTDDKPVTVSWETRNAVKVDINGQPVELNGCKTFHSMEPMKLVLTAENEMGVRTRSRILIDIDQQPPWIGSFKVKPAFAVQGSPVTLTWKVTKARKLVIDNGVGDVTGRECVTVTTNSNGVYHLTAHSYFGYASTAVASLAVYPVQLIDEISIPPPVLEMSKLNVPKTTFILLSKFNYHFELNFDQSIFPEPIRLEPITPLWRQHPQDISLKNAFASLPGIHRELIHMIKYIWKKRIKQAIRRILAQN